MHCGSSVRLCAVSHRLLVLSAIADMINRQDGVAFQRLARRLLEEHYPGLIPHAHNHDLGRDATFPYEGRVAILLASLTASRRKLTDDVRRATTTADHFDIALYCTPRSVTNAEIER